MVPSEDDLGHPVGLTGPPQRVVSLVPNLSEAMWSWGLGDRLVGVTQWCVSPPDGFPDAARVRGTKNPDVKAIVALAPDVVVANAEENRELDVRRLREAGVDVYVTSPRSVTQAAGSLARLAAVLGVGEQGQALAQAIRQAVDGAPAPSDRRPRVFCPIWRDPWMAVGTDTFAGDLLAVAGFDLVPDEPRYPTVDLDVIAAADVDVVLLPDEPYEFTEADHDAFVGWRAAIHHLDGAALTWWGPRTPAALTTLAVLVAGAR